MPILFEVLLYRLVEQIVIVTSLCWLQRYFLTGFVVCLGKCGSYQGRIFYLVFKPQMTPVMMQLYGYI